MSWAGIVRSIIDKNCREIPGLAQELFQVADAMNRGVVYPPRLVAALCQGWSRKGGYDVYDARVFSIIYDWMLNGEVVFCQIPLDGAPAPDQCEKENNAVLSRLPSELITGRFVGGVGDNDGSVSLIKTIGFESFNHKSEVAPSDLPLEVGTTEAWTSYRHLYYENGLARWPYRDRTLHLFKVTRLRVRDEINAKIFAASGPVVS